MRFSRALLILIVSLLLFAFALWQVGSYEARLTRSEGFVPLADGGVVVPVLTFNPPGKPKGIAIIAHGFAADKELMEGFGVELASRVGLTAYLFDFPGHGQSEQKLTFSQERSDTLTLSLDAIYNYAQRQAAVSGSPTGTLLLGHSMGSRPVALFGVDNPAVLATIPLSPAMADDDLRRFNPTTPRNLLLLAGEQDLPNSVRGVISGTLYASSGEAQASAISATFGDWQSGSARRGVLYPSLNHATVLFDAAVFNDVNLWAARSLGLPFPARTDGGRSGWVFVSLALGFIVSFGFVGLLIPFRRTDEEREEGPRFLGSATLTYLLMLVVGSVAALLTFQLLANLGWANPLDFLGLSNTPFLAGYFFVTGGLAWLVVRATNPNSLPPFDLGGVVGGLLVGGLAWLVVYVFVGVTASTFFFRLTYDEHNLARLPVTLALAALVFPFFSLDDAIWRGWQQTRRPLFGIIGGLLSKAIILAALGLGIIFLPGLGFFAIVLPVMLLVFIIAQLFGAWLFQATGSVWATGWWNALFFSWLLTLFFPATV